MENIISEYQRWKEQGTTIRTQARQAMEARFRELLTEAASIAQEYHADFGSALKPPPAITSFKYKAGANAKGRPGKTATTKKVVAKASAPPAPTAPPSGKVNALNKKLATAKKKLDDAKASGAATRNLEDRIYEIEDEIRLAQDH